MLSRGASLGRKDEPGAVADPQLLQSSRLIVEHESILQIIQTIVGEKLTLYRFVNFDISQDWDADPNCAYVLSLIGTINIKT